jgi:hypothetical protein
MGWSPLQQPPVPTLESEQIFGTINLNNAANHPKQLPTKGESRLAAIGPQGIGEDTCGKKLRIHKGQPGQALPEVELQAKTAVGAHHQPGSGVEEAHLQGGFQIHATVGTEQEHGPSIPHTGSNQRLRMAHVANH